MKILISRSAKNIGVLYHGTLKESLVHMLRTGMMNLASGKLRNVEDRFSKGRLFYASFTRSRDCTYFDFADCDAIMEIDGTALSNLYRIEPIDYYDNPKKRDVDLLDPDRRGEAEERLLSDKPQLPILKYIKHVYFIQPGVFEQTSKLHQLADPTGKDMASILLVLKKNGITYSFYPTLKDWRKRRSQFSAVITPKATPTRKVRKLDKDIYADTLALLHCLQNTMSDTDRDLLNRIVKNSSKVDMLVLNTLDYTNMSTYNTQNTMASLAIKTVRLLKRMQLNSTNSIRSYLIKALS